MQVLHLWLIYWKQGTIFSMLIVVHKDSRDRYAHKVPHKARTYLRKQNGAVSGLFSSLSEHNEHAIPLFSDAGRHRNVPRCISVRDLFLDISNVNSYNTRSSASNNFFTQGSRSDSLLNWLRFLELEQQFGTRCLLH